MRKFKDKVKDKSWIFHPKYHLLHLVVAPIALIISGLVFWFCFSIVQDYVTAPYKDEVTATIVEITEGSEEGWEYTDREEKDPRYRETRITGKKVYGLKWEYYINDKKYIWESSDTYSTSHKVGDTETMRFWSSDGIEYHRSYFGTFVFIIMGVCGLIGLVALYFIIKTLYVKIRYKAMKSKKKLK